MNKGECPRSVAMIILTGWEKFPNQETESQKMSDCVACNMVAIGKSLIHTCTLTPGFDLRLPVLSEGDGLMTFRYPVNNLWAWSLSPGSRSLSRRQKSLWQTMHRSQAYLSPQDKEVGLFNWTKFPSFGG